MTLSPSTTRHRTRWSRWGLAALVCVLAAPTVTLAAQGGDTLSGTGISRLDQDTRRLTIKATTSAADGAAEGRVSFIHHSPSGISRFKADVTCLRLVGQTAELSGVVTRGETAAGMMLTGRQFAFTVRLDDPQSFSLPRFAQEVAPCSGGRPQQVAVTQAGFRTR